MFENTKPGTVLYVKTSEEPVLFFASRPINEADRGKFPEYSGTGEVVIVRRPVMTETSGISYKFYDFLAEELESDDEQTKRLFGRIMSRQKLAMGDMETPSFHTAGKPS